MVVIEQPDGHLLTVEPRGHLDLVLYVCGHLPIKRDHGHIDPACYRDLRQGETIVTYCSICGDFLGRRPVEKPTRRRTR